MDFDEDGKGCSISVPVGGKPKEIIKKEILKCEELIPKGYESLFSSVYEQAQGQIYSELVKKYHFTFPFSVSLDEINATLFDWGIVYLLKSKENKRKAIKITNRSSNNVSQGEWVAESPQTAQKK